ncbi:MAG: AMP-binding protein [Muribaculaceae bacterium]|nr:AMP-binding protein [Muribaculaceae bacterium]
MNFQKIYCDSFNDNWDSQAISSYSTGLVLTYGGLANRIQRVCLYLEMLGVKRGTHIGIVGNNSIDWITNYMAAIIYGAVAVTVQVTYDAAQMLSLLASADVDILFIDPNMLNGCADPSMMADFDLILSQDLDKVLYYRDEKYSDATDKLRMLDSHFMSMYPDGFQRSDLYSTDTPSNAPMAIFFTAGTLGEPKPVVMTSDNIEGNVIFGIKKSLFPRGSKTLTTSSMGNVWGTIFNMLVPLASGSHLYVFNDFYNPEELINALKRVKPYRVIMSPLQLHESYELVLDNFRKSKSGKLLHALQPVSTPLLYRALRHAYHKAMGGNCHEVIVGSTNISRTLKYKLHEVGIRYTISYGLVECGGLVCYTPSTDFIPNTVGNSVNKIIKCRVRPLEINGFGDNIGVIEVQGMTVMKEYYNDPDSTREAFTADNWFVTRDLGSIDRNGNVHIVGRLDTIIQRPEGCIVPERIEKILTDYPQIKRAVIVDRDDKLTAIIEPDINHVDKADASETIKHIIDEINAKFPEFLKIRATEISSEPLEITLKGTVARYKYF